MDISTLLSSYNFWIIASATILLSAACGAVGVLSVHSGQSLVGDAVGHSSFPGIILSFIIFQSRDPLLLLLGAIFTAGLSYIFIQISKNNSKIPFDSALAIFLSGFFGLGMLLKSMIQGNPDYQGASQSGLDKYIFGQSAYIMQKDLFLIAAISIFTAILIIIFYKELSVFLFDREYAFCIGISSKIMHSILLCLIISLIAVGLKSVGAILISSLLIMPCVCANQWSKDFKTVLTISALTGAISAFTGSLLSSLYDGLSTGPVIILIMSIITMFSIVFGKFGLIQKIKLKRRN